MFTLVQLPAGSTLDETQDVLDKVRSYYDTQEGDNIVVATFWLIADSLTGLMAAPNLIGLILLSPVVFKLN